MKKRFYFVLLVIAVILFALPGFAASAARRLARIAALPSRASTRRRAMRKIAFLTGLLLATLALTASASAGRHTTITETNHVHGTFTEPEFSQNPCTGAAITSFQADGNVVEHQTYFIENGEVTEVWATFTETGKAALTDANGVTFAGHLTAWGNFNLNERNTNNTFTLTFMLSGSDGSTLVGHEVQHFALNANGVVTVDFDTFRLTCG